MLNEPSCHKYEVVNENKNFLMLNERKCIEPVKLRAVTSLKL